MSKGSMNFIPGSKMLVSFVCVWGGGGRTPHFASVFLVSFLSLLVDKEADSFPLYREESEERSFLVKNTRLCEKTHMTLFNF